MKRFVYCLMIIAIIGLVGTGYLATTEATPAQVIPTSPSIQVNRPHPLALSPNPIPSINLNSSPQLNLPHTTTSNMPNLGPLSELKSDVHFGLSKSTGFTPEVSHALSGKTVFSLRFHFQELATEELTNSFSITEENTLWISFISTLFYTMTPNASVSFTLKNPTGEIIFSKQSTDFQTGDWEYRIPVTEGRWTYSLTYTSNLSTPSYHDGPYFIKGTLEAE